MSIGGISPIPLLNRQTILIADDEPDMLDLVCRALTREGFEIETAVNGEIALEAIRHLPPSLAILDHMMPRMTGLEVCKAVRGQLETAHLPLIMLSARTSEVDRIVAFEVGVDDYVTKPFSPRELVLRVKALLRGAKPAPSLNQALTIGEITIEPESHAVRVKGAETMLTAIEYKLLLHLMLTPDRVHSREELLARVWCHEDVELRTVDTQVRRLRCRLGSAADQIETVRAFGYRLTAATPPQDAMLQSGDIYHKSA